MDLHFCLGKEKLDHDIVEEHLTSVQEYDSDGRCWRLYEVPGCNHGGSMQSGISATENRTARVYRGAYR
jgi:hypothetical protein